MSHYCSVWRTPCHWGTPSGPHRAHNRCTLNINGHRHGTMDKVGGIGQHLAVGVDGTSLDSDPATFKFASYKRPFMKFLVTACVHARGSPAVVWNAGRDGDALSSPSKSACKAANNKWSQSQPPRRPHLLKTVGRCSRMQVSNRQQR